MTVATRLAVLVALLLAVTGCHSGARHHAASSGAQGRFPQFTIVYNGLLDYLDPALSYTSNGWQAMWRTYIGLLTYKEASGPDGATVVPGLAEGLPRISADGRDYKFVLRRGLEYSNGAPVEAGDFKYAIKRLFLVDSPGVGFFTAIVGAESFSRTKKGDIRGIVVDDAARTVEFKLTQPRGDFQNILATIFAAPVPHGTPAKDQSLHPIPATGPYVITQYTPNRGFTLARNEKFRPTQYVSFGNPDRIKFEIVADDGVALQRVLSGRADYDYHQVPSDRIAEVQSKYGSRLGVAPSANIFYFFMNTRAPPFDKLAVRQAVNYAIDRDALVRLYGGLALATENVLPVMYPSYRKHELYPHDVAKATQLIEQAGARGARVTVWGWADSFGRPPAQYLADVLNKIGLKAAPKIIGASIYFTAIGSQATKAQVGVAGWSQDYPHPLDWFDVLLNGARITRTHNNNYSNADIPAINETIDRLKLEPTLTPAVDARWADLDRLVMQHALWAPFVMSETTDFFSDRVDMRCYVNHVLYRFDWYHACVK